MTDSLPKRMRESYVDSIVIDQTSRVTAIGRYGTYVFSPGEFLAWLAGQKLPSELFQPFDPSQPN